MLLLFGKTATYTLRRRKSGGLEGVECPLKDKKKKCQSKRWLINQESREKREVKEANVFSGYLNTVPVKVNLSQCMGLFDKGIPNAERFVGITANGLKIHSSMKEISYCNSVYWLTKEIQ